EGRLRHLDLAIGRLGTANGLGYTVLLIPSEDDRRLPIGWRRDMSKFAYPILHLLARLESDGFLWLDVHAFAGTRVPGFACFAHLHFENAKIAQLNATDFDERIDDGVEGLLNNIFGFELGQADPFRNLLDDLFLGHALALLTAAKGKGTPRWKHF